MNNKQRNESAKKIAKLLEGVASKDDITFILENLDVVILGANSKTLREAYATLEGNQELRLGAEDTFGMGYEKFKAIIIEIMNLPNLHELEAQSMRRP